MQTAMATNAPDPAPRAPLADELLTLAEAAERCTVNYETFRRWVDKGVLPYVTVGPHNLKRVRRGDVEQLIRDAQR